MKTRDAYYNIGRCLWFMFKRGWNVDVLGMSGGIHTDIVDVEGCYVQLDVDNIGAGKDATKQNLARAMLKPLLAMGIDGAQPSHMDDHVDPDREEE